MLRTVGSGLAWQSVAVSPAILAPTEPLAVASAVCGMSAFIPVVSQVFGVGLGLAGLLRIRDARSRGVPLRGAGWAWFGMAASAVALAGWVASAAALLLVGRSLAGAGDSLRQFLDVVPG